MLYNSLILPYMSYCNLTWGNATTSKLQKLITLQKKIIRVITGTAPRCHVDHLFKQFNILKFTDINKHQQSIFMYRCTNNLFPDEFCNLFQLNSAIHKYETRHANYIHLPKHRTLLFQHNIRYSGPKLWNIIPDTIKYSISLASFSRRMKKIFNLIL